MGAAGVHPAQGVLRLRSGHRALHRQVGGPDLHRELRMNIGDDKLLECGGGGGAWLPDRAPPKPTDLLPTQNLLLPLVRGTVYSTCDIFNKYE